MSNNNTKHPKVFLLTLAGNSQFSDNVLDFVGDYGQACHSLFVEWVSGNHPIQIRFNSDSEAIYTPLPGTNLLIGPDELTITKLEFSNSGSGSGTVILQLLCGLVASDLG